ncbi:permease prefix domain 1-containing protein [Deinococcus radiotolerans]|uniref:Uncharacterized protein n=1 Tax=Deinococcus radiotolerans TaxID=1309407 RepID=A0ABQ2FRK4_9DEIO|nr:permease prefix domain 1-containing protein [Deinococcus radiotolerans]GGL20039.1 hypothetical protein GCM10010844_43690 [Deinococcus radiotolerans]
MNATETHVACPPRLVAYLRRATLGLPASRRQELWDELEDHLLTRTRHLQLLGYAPDDALTRALTELGEPGRVSLGMGRVFHSGKALLTLVALTAGSAYFAMRLTVSSPLPVPVLNLPVSAARPEWCLRGAGPAHPHVMVQSTGLTCATEPRDVLPDHLGRLQVDFSAVQQSMARQGLPARIGPRGALTFTLAGRTQTVPAWAFSHGHAYGRADALLSALRQADPGLTLAQRNGRTTLRTSRLSLTLATGDWNPELSALDLTLAPAVLDHQGPAEAQPR